MHVIDSHVAKRGVLYKTWKIGVFNGPKNWRWHWGGKSCNLLMIFAGTATFDTHSHWNLWQPQWKIFLKNEKKIFEYGRQHYIIKSYNSWPQAWKIVFTDNSSADKAARHVANEAAIQNSNADQHTSSSNDETEANNDDKW